MNTLRIFFAVLFIFSAVNVFPAPYDMIPAGDPVLEDLLFLSLESGNPILSFTPPLSPHEIKIFLDSLDTDSLSASARNAYDRIEKRINPQTRINLKSDYFLFTLNINSTLETRTRFNSDISWFPQYPDIPSLVALPLNFYFSDSLQLYIEPALIMDPFSYANAGCFAHNVPMDMQDLDQTVPLRAFIALGNSWWNIQLGRDRLSFGTGQSGNLAISDNPQFHEFARLSFFSKYFKYSMLVSQMPLELNEDIVNYLEADSLRQTTQRYFYYHRIDFSIKNILTVSLSEGVMAGNTPLEIRYLNPTIIFHSLYSFWNYPKWDGSGGYPNDGTGDMNGSLFSFEINWNVIKSLAVYGQFVMNQISTPYKEQQFGDQPPNGFGYLVGSRYSHSLGRWGCIYHLEFAYTDPYLHMNPSPFASHIHMRYLGVHPGRLQYSFMGYPRDRILTTAGASIFNNDTLLLTGEFTWISQGEHTIKWDWEKTEDSFKASTPTGIAENRYILSLGAKWKINSFFTCKSSVTGIFSVNNAHKTGMNIAGGQLMASISFQY
ncbi:MAG: capsule assembly Wzi family protein [Treponema sp.]|nr:capsule assembly Wzi family protein [Treponema sp.]